MKKQLLALALLTAGFANAQTWTQNFASAAPPALPAGWMQNNVDGLTTSTQIASYNFGSNAGVTRNVTTAFSLPAMYGNALITTARYTPAGTSNDWVISPSFTVPANAVFNWDATSFDPSLLNAYEIRISTTGTAVADFTVNPSLFTTAGEICNTTAWTQRGVSLDAYAGQTVYLAVHEVSNAKWQLAMDNFSVMVPAQANDGSILTVNNLTRYMVGAGNQNINGTFKQLGYATATTAVMNYKINNGSTVTQTITFAPSVPYFGTQNFTFGTPASFGLGTNNVKVWVSAVNGSNEAVLTNDTAYQTVFVASQSVTIQALIEEFTSSTCGPCASLNSSFDPLLTSQGANTGTANLNAIKYQVNWPSPNNDPSYNNDVLTRRNFYAINAAPTVLYNGTPGSGNQTNINIAKAQPGYAAINSSITYSAGTVVANATITPYVTISAASPLRVYQALVQSYYNYPGASTSQKDYKHAMREMYPSAGTPITTTDGAAQTFSFSETPTYASIASGNPAQFSNNFWYNTGTFTYEYIVWVQDIVNDQVLQSSSAFTSSLTSSMVEFKDNSSIGVYPNPASDYAVVGIKLNNASSVDISITDVTGKLVYSNNGTKVNEGTNEIRINTSEFASGTYNVVVNTADGVLKEKLVVIK
jgi:hypothetical protein